MRAPTLSTTGVPGSSFVPTDYAELFARYYKYVCALVISSGIDWDNAEDVSMTILAKFYEKSVLEDFNPTHVTHHGGIARKAVFRTFLSGFVRSYVRHYRDRQQIDKHREPAIMDAPLPTTADDSQTWGEVHGPIVEPDYSKLWSEDLIRRIRNHLQSLPPSSLRCPLPDLFEVVLVMVAEIGTVDMGLLSQRVGVSPNTARARMGRLREEIKHVVSQ